MVICRRYNKTSTICGLCVANQCEELSKCFEPYSKTDEELMSNILNEICEYAILNNMEPDETIKTISQNFMKLLEISTFNNYQLRGE